MSTPNPNPDTHDITYRIERCFADDRPRKVIRAGLTLNEAQAHCEDPHTHGDDWFDAYYEES